MVAGEMTVLAATESVCPECLARIPAQRVADGENVYLEKSCPEHGSFRTVIWRGQPDFTGWVRPKIPTYPANPLTQVEQGCPFDCGLCPDHRQQTCTALLEVTGRCNLACPTCFADAGSSTTPDPALVVIEGWYRRLLTAGGPYNIQLSGGEPTLRDDLPEVVALGRFLGFSFIQVNTNGLRLARDPVYVDRLKDAGLASVFLQFDGTVDAIYESLRGRRLLAEKELAIEQCARAGIGVVLVPTLVPKINMANIGAIIRFGLERLPAVRGVHFQPISYFGRYAWQPGEADRATLPEVMQAIERQTGGLVSSTSFRPPGCENSLCSFHGNFVLMPDGALKTWTKQQACDCQLTSAAVGAAQARRFVANQWPAPNVATFFEAAVGPGLGGWDELLHRARTHTFSISGMAFQDAWTLDLERLRGCCIHTVSPAGRIIPFCAYNLTSRSGHSLYRNGVG